MTILLKLIGLINAGYFLLSIHGTKVCATGQGCSEVLSSIYASILGVPLALVGVALYAVLLLLNFLIKKDNLTNESFHNATLAILTPAAGAGIVLMIVIMGSDWFFLSFLLTKFLIANHSFGLSYKQYKGDFKFQLSISQWVALVLIALLPITVAKEVFKKRSLNNVIGVIAVEEVTLGDFADLILIRTDLNRKINQLKWEFINQKVLELEAKKNNLPLNNYVQSKVLNQIPNFEEEMRAFYEENKHEVPGKSFEEVKPYPKFFISSKRR